jgi:ferritin-like metal-binding protein YciE
MREEIDDPRALFLHGLRTMYGVEEALRDDVLPRLRARVHAASLVCALDRHLLETEQHVENLRRVFTLVGESRAAVRSPALAGLESEHDRALAAIPEHDRAVVDLAIAQAILRTEHLEVAGYESLVTLALALGVDGLAVHLLRENAGQDAYALEQAEHALAQLVAEKVEAG